MREELDRAKKLLRKEIKKLKEEISLAEKRELSKLIWQKLKTKEKFLQARTVMFYWSMDDEVNTHDFIVSIASEKQIILPSVRGKDLILKYFTGVENMVSGEGYGIPEPKEDFLGSMDEIDIIIVPGIAFDINRNRMGRGKAYYDKLLSESKAHKIGVCFDMQLLKEIPFDEHDVRMNELITEKRNIL